MRAGGERRPRKLVLAVSHANDPHARAVLAALRRRGAAAQRIGTAAFPERLALRLTLPHRRTGWRGRLSASGTIDLDSDRVTSVWWRRPNPFALQPSVKGATWGGVYCACDVALESCHLPLLFQERIAAVADVRVTVVGDDLFAAEIDFPRSSRPLDWRSALCRARVRPVQLPGEVEERLRRLVRRLQLAYAAIDLRRRRDGAHVFLEANPSGQWRFVEERTGQPITAALADLLARGPVKA